MTKETGGPAFPRRVTQISLNGVQVHQEQDAGMTLRDYFAAQAMSMLYNISPDFEAEQTLNSMATVAYKVADAMLKARE